MAKDTRERLVAAALALFREAGYQATTMRRIADEAGLSLGNAYYYFSGKDELVHELYVEVQREHRDRALADLVAGASLADNLRVVLHAGLDVMAPYHGFGTTFVQQALPASSDASPFSERSADARSMAVGLMDHVVATSKVRVPGGLRGRLPTLLWILYLGVTLHWVVDASPDQVRTRALVDRLAPVVAKAVALARLPVARGLVDDVVALVPPTEPPR
ncbi:TetR family transcriptional regulator [Mumia sp. DW29H23]|uniref:TetR/AcrR family transcriptional regulator n=1 Tax=Mumia sp. DW29H23 TaxID=3421241 RepID=UPI003D68438C